MTRAFIIAALLSAAGCVGTGGTSNLASTPTDTAADRTPPEMTKVLEVKASTLTDDTVCRAEKPTGTQISVRRCRSGDTDETDVSQATTLRDIEEMRARQNLQQMRDAQNALNAAQRRVPGF